MNPIWYGVLVAAPVLLVALLLPLLEQPWRTTPTPIRAASDNAETADRWVLPISMASLSEAGLKTGAQQSYGEVTMPIIRMQSGIDPHGVHH